MAVEGVKGSWTGVKGAAKGVEISWTGVNGEAICVNGR